MRSTPILMILALSLAACDGPNPTEPSAPLPRLIDLTGEWSAQWRVQFERHRDGFSGEFICRGSLTLSQTVTAGASGPLSGFAVVTGNNGCPVGSFDIGGSIRPGGSLRLTTVGPKPPTGQCPYVARASYDGVVQNESGGAKELSVRAQEIVDCPGPGEGRHTFTYILTGWDY